jgi:hypothetical protein
MLIVFSIWLVLTLAIFEYARTREWRSLAYASLVWLTIFQFFLC